MTAKALGSRADPQFARQRFRPRLCAGIPVACRNLRRASFARLPKRSSSGPRRSSISCAFPTRFSTGSSIMPQKKEPGRRRTGTRQDGPASMKFAGRASHHQKGLPLAYSKDMQEDRNRSSTCQKSELAIAAMAGMVRDHRQCRSHEEGRWFGYSTATDLDATGEWCAHWAFLP
ncbi:hypothetical protein VXQ18_17100 [Brucella abortus]|nr:hypothetical protein [Brucella abortus]